MTAEIRGTLDGTGLRIGIVTARFNREITSRLLAGARAALAQHGVAEDCVTVVSVPGSFEIPLAASKMAESGRYDSVVCLGAVIKGETDHYQHIAEAASRGIARAALDTGVAVIFGVLTTDSIEQAWARAGGEGGEHVTTPKPPSKPGLTMRLQDVLPDDGGHDANGDHNEGYSAALAAIEMANLIRALDST